MGIHESVLNYAGNKDIEAISCPHEEISVAMANGYAKIDGKPVLVCAHATVGAQHAAMAVYDAWCDRVPIYLVLGNTQDAEHRQGEVYWVHSAQDPGALVRDMTKWDDNPASLNHFAESAVRAYKIAMTPPMGPVAIVVDDHMQEQEVPRDLRIPKLTVPTPPAGDSGAVAEMAKLLVEAENPVILASRAARTQAGLALMVELAEALQAGVVDSRHRLNFPTRHPLAGGNAAEADVVLALETGDISNVARQARQRNAKVISMASTHLFQKSNYQDFMRYAEVDMSVAADAEATLPALIEEIKRLTTASRRETFRQRGLKVAEANRNTYERARTEATYGWDASPVSTARLSMELWAQLKTEDWSYVTGWVNWPLRLWDFDKPYQYIGRAGGEGVGYYAPASIGAALANKKHGRLSVSIQPDGDMMVAPGALWTAARHQIPILIVMQNNRAYHQEVMWFQRAALLRKRGLEHTQTGFGLGNPDIDFATLARSMGVASSGPITDPKDLAAAIRRGIQVVKGGEPYLIDVVTQPRPLSNCAECRARAAAREPRFRRGRQGRVPAHRLPGLPRHRGSRRGGRAARPGAVAARGAAGVGAQRQSGLVVCAWHAGVFAGGVERAGARGHPGVHRKLAGTQSRAGHSAAEPLDAGSGYDAAERSAAACVPAI
jgi:acetolactate synthase-1/2/3 large subunit